MKSKIYLAIFVSILVIASCKKNELSKIHQINTQEAVENTAIRSSVFQSISRVLHSTDLNSLDWDKAEIEAVGSPQRTITVTVTSRTDSDKKLVYLQAGDIKLYQWAGEVHVVPSN